MRHRVLKFVGWAVLALGALLLTPNAARAHWCNSLWASSYNVVVRPESDTLTVPPTGLATLDIWVQNNMGYPLEGFGLTADASGYIVNIASVEPKVDNFLMPGENLRHTLTVERSGGDDSLAVEDLTFYMVFGASIQDNLYGIGATGVMIKKTNDELIPAPPVTSFPDYNSQGLHLRSSATADFGDFDASIHALLEEYCAGRGSWDSGNGYPITGYCPDENTTQDPCPSTVTRVDSRYDWQHLWAAHDLAYRRDAMSAAQRNTTRDRLICGWDDDNDAFKAFTTILLGYLGDEVASTTVQDFLESKLAGSTLEAETARAALLLMGETQYAAAVHDCLDSGDDYTEMGCAAALGIAESDDATVEAELLPRVAWNQPDLSGENGLGFTAAHLLNLVAWDRRGWAPNAGDVGTVSFYVVTPDTIPPEAPANLRCQTTGSVTDPELQVLWDPVTLDDLGGSEIVNQYWLQWGTQARPGTCLHRADLCDSYQHGGNTGNVYHYPESLVAGETYFFTVSAVDDAANESAFSVEIACDAPIPAAAPVAVITCDTTYASAPPLTINCHGSASTDANNNIDHYYFSLDGGPQVDNVNFTTTFNQAGSHSLVLTVVDDTALQHSDSESIVVDDPGNAAPVPVIAATPTTGEAALTVDFDSTGTSDPNGDNLTYAWDFGDSVGSSTDPSPTYTYNNDGTYFATLTVTDDGAGNLEGIASVRIDVLPAANRPPDLASASVNPLSGSPGLQVHGDATGIYDPDGDGYTIQWDFDDTTTSNLASVDHTFASVGVYNVVLSAQDDGAPAIGPAERTFTVTVSETQNLPPDASAAEIRPSSGYAPLRATLDASACTDPDGDHLSFEWAITRDFTDDPVRVAGDRVEYTFDEVAAYEVQLTVTDDGAPSLQARRTLRVNVREPRTGNSGFEVGGSCACGTGSAGPLTWLVFGLLGLTWRYRRRR